MKAIVLQGETGKAALVTDRPAPKPRPGYVLVDVKAVALNPTDWKHMAFVNVKGAVVGCDVAGVVAETNTGYKKNWKVGDRIMGFAHGGNSLNLEDGAFAERVALKADMAIRIPDSLSFEDAATLPLGLVTVGQGLFQEMGLNIPTPDVTVDTVKPNGETILIYGGSSATGTLGIQLAKLAGYTPITTASKRNFGLVKSLGAVAAFDYSDPAKCAAEIREYTNNSLKLAWDTIALPEAAKICADALAPGPGATYGSILAIKSPREDVKNTFSLAYTSVGEGVNKPHTKSDPKPDHFEFIKKWMAVAETLLKNGQVKPHPKRVGKGLEGVLDGCEEMKAGKVSGQKLVYAL
ncbi:hypothetical protein Plec18167_003868 [Paecilomyces lecythidis]|uniref:Enoyl reductase (ER) domain-containing protein n=1 Tax=Paecilomyces lecythidis TaxID=3004212 RepID=A0ABR3XWU4_9EURO